MTPPDKKITAFVFLFCFILTGCASYKDIHGNAKLLDVFSLSVPHVYKTSQPADSAYWWQAFRDPQLSQFIETALADSPDIQIAETRIRQAESIAQEAGAALWPSAGFNGYVQRQKFSTFGLVPPPFNGHTYNIGTLGLNFNYEFDFWGKNRQLLNAKKQETAATEAELAEAQLILATAIANTWFQLRHDIAQTKIANTQRQLKEEMLRIITHRAQQGIDSDLPVKALETDLQAVKLSFEKCRQAEALSRHQLAVLLGKNPLATEIEAAPLTFHAYSITLPTSLPASLLAQRPDIIAARARTEAAASQVNVAKARFFPNINLGALYSYQSVGLEHLFQSQSQNNAVTGVIDLPIFDAEARRAHLGAKYAEYDLAVNEYNQTILKALHETADQLSILRTVNLQLAAQNTAFNAAQQHYKLYDSRYNEGIVDYIKVLENKQSLLQQEAIKADLQTRHLQAVVALVKALGGKLATLP